MNRWRQSGDGTTVGRPDPRPADPARTEAARGGRRQQRATPSVAERLLLFPSFPAPAPEAAATVTGHPGVTAAGERRAGESEDVRLPDRRTVRDRRMRGARADGARTSRNGRRGRAATGRHGEGRRRAANGEEDELRRAAPPLDSSSRIHDGRSGGPRRPTSSGRGGRDRP